MRLLKYISTLIFILTVLNANQNTTITGNANYYFINRLSNSDLINIPFRLINVNIYHQRDKVDVNGTVAIEYKPRTNTDFIYDSEPVDFKVIMRELATHVEHQIGSQMGEVWLRRPGDYFKQTLFNSFQALCAGFFI